MDLRQKKITDKCNKTLEIRILHSKDRRQNHAIGLQENKALYHKNLSAYVFFRQQISLKLDPPVLWSFEQ